MLGRHGNINSIDAHNATSDKRQNGRVAAVVCTARGMWYTPPVRKAILKLCLHSAAPKKLLSTWRMAHGQLLCV